VPDWLTKDEHYSQAGAERPSSAPGAADRINRESFVVIFVEHQRGSSSTLGEE